MRKGKIALLIVGLLVLIFLILLVSSKYMGVGTSDETEGLMFESEVPVDEETGDERDLVEMVTRDTEEVIGYPISIYDVESVEDDEKDFLGARYTVYKDIFDKIEESYKDLVIEEKKVDETLSMGVVSLDDGWGPEKLDAQGLSSQYSGVTVKNSMTIVGFFNGVCAIYAYNYENPDCNEFVVVDYSETPFMNEVAEVFRIGDVKNVYLDFRYCVFAKYNGYQITFMKGRY